MLNNELLFSESSLFPSVFVFVHSLSCACLSVANAFSFLLCKNNESVFVIHELASDFLVFFCVAVCSMCQLDGFKSSFSLLLFCVKVF